MENVRVVRGRYKKNWIEVGFDQNTLYAYKNSQKILNNAGFSGR